ncbi:BCL-2-associated athanogene 4 [Hibiscus trionum]|uniref:BCL-2-associated athanogene 4 n=1 Tax=Hibiscus trionum TaxID=183268 RepID=A0A9W7LYS4_HIBTR|nr:BCL-2-associated athanogene 4 [Hibiscus trionum]
MRNPNAKSEETTPWEARPGGMLVQRRDHREDDDIHHNHDHGTAPASSGGPMVSDGPTQHQLHASVPVHSTVVSNDNMVQEMKESEEMSKAFAAVAGVRKEVDKLSERVAALEVAVNSGTKVANEEFDVSAELLMRELLKLDGIEAEGEAKLQRKAEVRRVQNFHDTLDKLKTRNSNPFSDKQNAVKVSTNWETFDSGMGSLTPPPPMSFSTNQSPDWERFD